MAMSQAAFMLFEKIAVVSFSKIDVGTLLATGN